MKFEFVKKNKSKNCLMFYSKEEWKKEKGKIKKIVGDDFSAKNTVGDVSVSVVYGFGDFKRLVIVGLDNEKNVDLEVFRRASNSFASKAKEMKLDDVQVDLTNGFKFKSDYIERAVMDGIVLGQYSFLKYKEKEAKKEVNIKKIFFKSDSSKEKEVELRKAVKVLDNVLMVRDLVNETSDKISPVGFEKIAKKVAKKTKLKIKVLDEKEIKKNNMGLITAVSRGSDVPPRLIILEHINGKKKDPLVALVGKGITFDSGGLNLKPSGNIETMRMDMAGAATVLGIMKSISELDIKKNVVGVMPLAENSVDSKSYKPGDIFKAYDGTTVEIKNTDAEGRLILADACAYTVKKYKPDFMIDFATLTGACLVCLGEMAAAIISNDDMADKLQEFSHNPVIYERTWRLPVYDEAKESLKSKIADIKNLGFDKGYAGTITGGLFIGHFVKNTPWIHLDIAGTGMYDETKHYMRKGGTGFGVRLIVDFLNNAKFEKYEKTKK